MASKQTGISPILVGYSVILGIVRDIVRVQVSEEHEKNEIIDRPRKFAEPYCVTDGKKFRLKDVDPADTGEATPEDKPRAKELLETGIQALAELQDVLYAQDRWSVLLIFQAMDAAGKDGAIKHVMSGVNPQGCQVYSFK